LNQLKVLFEEEQRKQKELDTRLNQLKVLFEEEQIKQKRRIECYPATWISCFQQHG